MRQVIIIQVISVCIPLSGIDRAVGLTGSLDKNVMSGARRPQCRTSFSYIRTFRNSLRPGYMPLLLTCGFQNENLMAVFPLRS